MINKEIEIGFTKQRQKARSNGGAIVHAWPLSEPHQTTGDLNEDNQICWCEPNIEDFTHEGGGILIVHKAQVWQ